jgi:hypothetical protein
MFDWMLIVDCMKPHLGVSKLIQLNSKCLGSDLGQVSMKVKTIPKASKEMYVQEIAASSACSTLSLLNRVPNHALNKSLIMF